jgi:C1A family cysteine protease
MTWRLRKTEKYAIEIPKVKKGIVPSIPDSRDYHSVAALELPGKCSLPKFPGLVKNQGKIGSCGSHAFSSAFELRKRMLRPNWELELSELFHYWVVRSSEYMNTIPFDSGQNLRDGCKVFQKIGIAPEILCPYRVENLNEKPSTLAFAFARLNKVKSYIRCYNTNEIFSQIAEGRPVVVGVIIFDSFVQYKGGAPVRIQSGNQLGGHAMVVTGYDTTERTIELLNSWGERWGDAGYCKMSIDCFKRFFMEAWSLEVE